MPKAMGYCRVSSIDQNETRQTLKMKSLGIGVLLLKPRNF